MFKLKKCALCGGNLKVINVPLVVRQREDVGAIVFGDVPAQQCVECGERYFPAAVAKAMDRVIRERIKANETIELPYFPMGKSAVR